MTDYFIRYAVIFHVFFVGIVVGFCLFWNLLCGNIKSYYINVKQNMLDLKKKIKYYDLLDIEIIN